MKDPMEAAIERLEGEEIEIEPDLDIQAITADGIALLGEPEEPVGEEA